MDNCDLEKLSVSAGKLRPAFTPEVTDYKVKVESGVNDSRRSDKRLWGFIQYREYRPLLGEGSSTIKLKDGVNRVEIEVVAEDGTIKKYSVEIIKLSAKLSNLALEGNISLHPAFCTKVFEYNRCDGVKKLSELGSHILDCLHKPTGDLDAKDATETDWYKNHFESGKCHEIETKHIYMMRNWEKRLQITAEEDSVDKLCALAQEHLKLYRQHLPKPGM